MFRVGYVLAQKLGIAEDMDDAEILNQEIAQRSETKNTNESENNREKIGFRDRKVHNRPYLSPLTAYER